MKRNTRMIAILVFCLAMMVSSIALADEKKDSEERVEIDTMAKETLKELFGSNEDAKALYDKAIGYAVFSNVKVQLGLSLPLMLSDPIFMVSMGQLRLAISALNSTWTRVSANSVRRTE